MLEKINALAIEAGKKIMEIYAMTDFSTIIDFKSDHSPLTLADKESNRLIEAGLKQLTPNIPIISEEGKDVLYPERKNWKEFWLVDPLDGTKEFIKRNGEFTVNIALIRNGVPVMGSIYAPAFDVLYYGDKTNGAYKTANGKTEKITVKTNRDKIVAVGSRSHGSLEEQEVLLKYGVTDVVTTGSSLKFCLLAEGSADVYYRHGPTMEWDTAAGQAILEAAGGKVVKPNMQPFTYNKTTLLNGGFLALGSL